MKIKTFKIKNTELKKYKICTSTQKELLNLFNDLLKTILINNDNDNDNDNENVNENNNDNDNYNENVNENNNDNDNNDNDNMNENNNDNEIGNMKKIYE